ncbi:MAG: lytic transglycosylase domain-containing protein, partial [Deltaproteobacteria bacterium]|nr:lytic transglycosylase domain-containing protein [Deltaproteobacteria bacterium]
RFGVTNSLDPRQNIDGGTKYLRFLMDRFKGDYRLVLAGYNAGEANVEKYGNKIPPFAETKAYVPNVLAYADTIYQILHSPPQVASANLPPHARKV